MSVSCIDLCEFESYLDKYRKRLENDAYQSCLECIYEETVLKINESFSKMGNNNKDKTIEDISDYLSFFLMTWNYKFYRFCKETYLFYLLETLNHQSYKNCSKFENEDLRKKLKGFFSTELKSKGNQKIKIIDFICEIRNERLSTEYLESHENILIEVFEKFLEATGCSGKTAPVSLAKGMHVLAPNFFPLADSRVFNYCGFRYDSKSNKEKAKIYFNFCNKIAEEIENINKNSFNIENYKKPSCVDGFEKSLLKLLDEYLYYKYSVV